MLKRKLVAGISSIPAADKPEHGPGAADIEDEEFITLSDLPDDIMTRILAELPPRELARVMSVAREWSDYATKAAGLRAGAPPGSWP